MAEPNAFYQDVFLGVREEADRQQVELKTWLGREVFPLAALQYQQPDGLILGPIKPEDLSEVASNLPYIGCSNFSSEGIRPSVVNDDVEVGIQAARAVAEAGYTHIALFEPPNLYFSQQRVGGAITEAERLGLTWSTMDTTLRAPKDHETFGNVLVETQQALIDFLNGLPENSALADVSQGWIRESEHILEKELHRAIPEEIGLLHVDQPYMDRSTLAKVELNGKEVGRRLVINLLKHIQGEEVPAVEKIPPLGFKPGKSLRGTEVLQIYNRTQEWAEQHLCDPVTVDDLCKTIGLSRRSLEQKLHHAGLPPPYEILTRMRLEKGKELLLQSSLRMEEVAEHCGFNDARAFRKRFKAYTGQTPREWRNTEGKGSS